MDTVFHDVKTAIECPFSAAASIAAVPQVLSSFYTQYAIDEAADHILKSVVKPEGNDGVSLTFICESWGKNLTNLSFTLRALLKSLAQIDSSARESMSAAIHDADWRFKIGGEVFFILVLAPAYPECSSRYNNGGPATHIVFQPQSSFQSRWPKGENCIPNNVRRNIRRAFKIAGKPYDASISTGPYEAYRFIKPLFIGDKEIHWWEEEPRVHTKTIK